jgi:hypothetical protein
MRTSTKEVSSYSTWYDFKSELQRRSGIIVLNRLWIQIKPKAPLPWYEFHMKEALASLSSRIQRLTVCPRCSGNLVLDRDIDGYYKRCIQCSFNIAFEAPAAVRPKPAEKKLYPWRLNIATTIHCHN